jgi:hypothetical protein
VADCQSAAGFHPAPLRLSHIPWPQEVRAFAKR